MRTAGAGTMPMCVAPMTSANSRGLSYAKSPHSSASSTGTPNMVGLTVAPVTLTTTSVNFQWPITRRQTFRTYVPNCVWANRSRCGFASMCTSPGPASRRTLTTGGGSSNEIPTLWFYSGVDTTRPYQRSEAHKRWANTRTRAESAVPKVSAIRPGRFSVPSGLSGDFA